MYKPAEDSYLIEKEINDYASGRVLDVGTGSGILAKKASQSSLVREVIAIDINPEVISALSKQGLNKIKPLQSDLFKQVEGCFDLIICNPPYLPEDKREPEDSKLATTGGRYGWEFTENFFKQVSKHMFGYSKILYLFSSLTDKNKVDQIISENLFVSKELASQKLPHEQLFVYLVEKSDLLRKIEQHHIENIAYFAKGQRGLIYTASLDRSKLVKTHLSKKDDIKVAIKVNNPESKAINRIENEVNWLRKLNRQGIGPKLILWGELFLVYRFIDGVEIMGWLKTANTKDIKDVLSEILEQCYLMDQMKVNKGEMHHPIKHILIQGGHPWQIDFERCTLTEKPQNVTQFVEFICRIKDDLVTRGLNISLKEFRELAKTYRENPSRENLKVIVHKL